MNREELRLKCRTFLNDIVEPYGVSDDTLNFRINEAVKEACTRADLIIDTETTKFCNINIVAGTNNYSLNPLIIDVLRVTLPSAYKPLLKLGYKAFDEDDWNWQTRNGTPTGYALDVSKNKIYFSHVPLIDEVLSLNVSRLPTRDLSRDTDSPEIDEKYHFDLVYWALHLCYLDHDLDTYDQAAADRYEALFVRKFGERKTAKDLEHRLRKYRRRAKAQFT